MEVLAGEIRLHLLERMGVIVLNPCDKPSEIGKEDKNTRGHIERLKVEGKFQQIRDEYGVIRNARP